MHIKQNGDGVFLFQIMIFNENINMANGDIKILENLSINQNVICWVLSYIGVAYAEANNLCYLSCAGWFLFLLSSISIMITLIFYTIHYCRKKWNKED